uniref:Uncharacterized protein n=1 Tax=Cucumis melo TaxID=3656 RepID=A0A9I9CUI3_CUCME
MRVGCRAHSSGTSATHRMLHTAYCHRATHMHRPSVMRAMLHLSCTPCMGSTCIGRACIMPCTPCLGVPGQPSGGRTCIMGRLLCQASSLVHMGYLDSAGACASVLLLVPMDCACSPAHGVVMGTYHDMHVELVGYLLWAHANAMGMFHGHIWAVTWLYWDVVRAWLAPPWPCFKSLVTRSDVNFRVFFT